MRENPEHQRKADEPFFVGYLTPPRPLVFFLAAVVGVLLGIATLVSVAFVSQQQDWVDAAFQWGEGRQTRTGIVIAQPYPVLYLPPSDEHPAGRSIPLSGGGKTGVQELAARMVGGPSTSPASSSGGAISS